MEKVFFDENGITQTSANFIANQAKEFIQSLSEKLNVSFINHTIGLINSSNTKVVSKGSTDISFLEETLNSISECKSLIAWLREAIKAKEEYCNKKTTLEEYCSNNNITIPIEPRMPNEVTFENVFKSLNIKERNRYYYLEALVSTYGKYIHPSGEFSQARKELTKKISNPISYSEDGANTIIHEYTPSIFIEDVDKAFFNLQTKWREYQAEFNAIKHKIELKVQETNSANKKKYTDDYKLYSSTYKDICNQYNSFVYDENIRKSKLKIVIPNELKNIYTKISNLGK